MAHSRSDSLGVEFSCGPSRAATALLSQSVYRAHNALTDMRPHVQAAERERRALIDGRQAFENELAWMRGSLAQARARNPRPATRLPPRLESVRTSKVWVPAVAVSIALHSFILTRPQLSLDPPPAFLLPYQDSSFIHILSISELKTPAVRRSIPPPMAAEASPHASDAPASATQRTVEVAPSQLASSEEPRLDEPANQYQPHTTPADGQPPATSAPVAVLEHTQDAAVVFVRAPEEPVEAQDEVESLAISDRNVPSSLLDRSSLTSLTEGLRPEGQSALEGEAKSQDITGKGFSDSPGTTPGAPGTSPHAQTLEIAGPGDLEPMEPGSQSDSPDAGLEPLPAEAAVAGTHTLVAPGDQYGAPNALGHSEAAPTGNTTLDSLSEASVSLPNPTLPQEVQGQRAQGLDLEGTHQQARRWGLERRARSPGQGRDRLARLGRHFRLRGRAQNTLSESVAQQAAAQQASSPQAGSSNPASRSPLSVVPDIVALGNASRVPSRETPLGRYLAGVDDHLRAGWVLPLEVRALGVQGACEVTFTVDDRGRVQDKYLSRRSGRLELDRLALSAVPSRLGKMPSDLSVDTLTVRYTFRSTDTLIAGSR